MQPVCGARPQGAGQDGVLLKECEPPSRPPQMAKIADKALIRRFTRQQSLDPGHIQFQDRCANQNAKQGEIQAREQLGFKNLVFKWDGGIAQTQGGEMPAKLRKKVLCNGFRQEEESALPDLLFA